MNINQIPNKMKPSKQLIQWSKPTGRTRRIT